MRRIPFDICLCLVCLSAVACAAPPATGPQQYPPLPGGPAWQRPPNPQQYPPQLQYAPQPQFVPRGQYAPQRQSPRPQAAPHSQPPATPPLINPNSPPAGGRQGSTGLPPASLGAPQPFPPANAATRGPPAPASSPGTNPAPPAVNVSTQTSGRLWISTTKSAGNRPIEVARFGGGPQFILILGSIHGNEAESIELIDALVQLIHDNPPPPELTLLLVRTPNPDGLADLMRTNAAGVDLNRNFPSPDFTSSPTRETGPRPASEAETRYLLQILQQYKPVRVVHLRSSIGERPLVFINDHWPAAASTRFLPNEAQVSPFEGGFKAGSLEEFVTDQLQTPLATVHLPPRGFRQLQAAELLRFATAHASAGKVSPIVRTEDSPATDRPAEPAVTRTDGEKGNVELLPPPPELAATSRVGKPRFEELPPPPKSR